MLAADKIKHYGDELFAAMMSRSVVAPLTDREPEITVQDAYEISKRYLAQRLEKNSETLVGKKIGVTSDAVQSMLAVFEPDFGFLTDAMQASEGDVSIGHLIQPRAEAEIAFRLKQDLMGPGISAKDVLDATDAVLPCFEIVDSRIQNWQIKIQDTVSDNASCGIFILGSGEIAPHALDLAACEVTVTKNNARLSSGFGSAVQGSPQAAVAWLANTFGSLGLGLKAGEIVLSGSLVPLEPIVAGDSMHMSIPGLGATSVNFVD